MSHPAARARAVVLGTAVGGFGALAIVIGAAQVAAESSGSSTTTATTVPAPTTTTSPTIGRGATPATRPRGTTTTPSTTPSTAPSPRAHTTTKGS